MPDTKRPAHRPKLPDDVRLVKESLRITNATRRDVFVLAANAGITPSEWMRKAIESAVQRENQRMIRDIIGGEHEL